MHSMMMKSSSSTATTTSLLGGRGGGGGRGGVRKGAWSHEEDLLLRKCIEKYGEGKWGEVPIKAGLNRCRKSCRLRWLNYLRPNIKRGEFTYDEVDLIVRMHKLLGNRWTLIAGRIPGRTANDIKNYCNTHLKEMVLSRHHHHHNKDHDQLLKTAADHDHGNNKFRTIKPEAIKVLEPLPRTFSTRKELFQQQQPLEGGHGEFIDINSSNSNRVSTNSTSLAAAAAAAAATHSDADAAAATHSDADEKEKLLNSLFGDEGDMELMNNINMERWDDCDLHLDDNLWRLLDIERELM